MAEIDKQKIHLLKIAIKYMSHAFAGLAVGLACYTPYLYLVGGALNQAQTNDDPNVILFSHSIPAGQVAAWGFSIAPVSFFLGLCIAKLRPIKQLISWGSMAASFILMLLFGAVAVHLCFAFVVFRGWFDNHP